MTDVTTATKQAQAAREALENEAIATAEAQAHRDALRAAADAADLELIRAQSERRRHGAAVIAEHSAQQVPIAGAEAEAAIAAFRESVTSGPLAPLVDWTAARMRQGLWARKQEAALRTMGQPHVDRAGFTPMPDLDAEHLAALLAKAIADAAREQLHDLVRRLDDAERLYVEGVVDSPLPG